MTGMVDDAAVRSQSESDELDFERATFAEGADTQRTCSVCSESVKDAYYVHMSNTVCEACQPTYAAAQMQSSFWSALGYGSLAAGVGALVWYGIRELTGYELGLIAIVVGVIVGIGVRKGAGSSRSRGYQVLAVTLAYLSIVSTYVPAFATDFIEGAAATDGAGPTSTSDAQLEAGAAQPEADGEDVVPPATPVQVKQADSAPPLLVVFGYLFGMVMALLMPALMLTDGQVMGVVILGIGVWEAWRRSAHNPEDEIAGPFRIADAIENASS